MSGNHVEIIEMQTMEEEPSEAATRSGLKYWGGRARHIVRDTNEFVNKSTFGRVFRLKDSGHVSHDRRSHHPLPCSFELLDGLALLRCHLLISVSFCEQPKAIEDANFSTEIRAGLTTFATMAYIIAVNVSSRGFLLVPRLGEPG
jgi:adenine/guanine/hypoxanthine permease